MTKTFNTRLVFKTLGALLVIEAFFMAVPTLVSWLYREPDTQVFLLSTVVTLVSGLIGVLIGRKAERHVGEREGYLIVAVIWLMFSFFGMMPYYLSGAIPDFTDAYFETISGFTTTGATILNDIESLTHGCLLWRNLTQWLGGMGIIVLSIAILPMFGLGGMQLYAAEVTGLSYEKLSPRIADTAKRMWALYIILTAVETVMLWLFGMDFFDSVCHSFSTIATGGYSTKNLSIAYYTNPAIQYTISFFMFISGINFALLYYVILRKPKKLLQDEETHWYAVAVLVATVVLTFGLLIHTSDWTWAGGEKAFRQSLFTTIATMTSTGYAVADYTQWPPLLWVTVFFLMFTGACAGSTSGGIKWIRLAIFAKNGFAEFKRRIHPNAIIPAKMNGKPITQQTTNNVMAFLTFYIFVIIATVLAFCALGVNFDESIGATVSAIGNVGPSIGQYGPAGTYAAFPTVGKWIMAAVMLIGRLEIFTVLLLFSPALWRK